MLREEKPLFTIYWIKYKENSFPKECFLLQQVKYMMFDNLFNLINRFLHPLAEEYLSSLDFLDNSLCDC